jgi:hypothetical protein
MKQQTIYPPEHSWFIWRVSWVSAISAAFGFYRGNYDLAIVPAIIWLTSMNYWRHPVRDSWRRYIDMACVQLGAIYHTGRVYMLYNNPYYHILVVICVLCYPVSNYYQRKQHLWTSTILHSLIHVIGNIAQMVVYYFLETIN